MIVLWGVPVLRTALRHITTEAMLAELLRNQGLRRVIGIESESGVLKKWNTSRFEETLGQEPHRTLLKKVFNVLIERLGLAVADLGHDTAGDATALSARRKPAEAAQGRIDQKDTQRRTEFLAASSLITVSRRGIPSRIEGMIRLYLHHA